MKVSISTKEFNITCDTAAELDFILGQLCAPLSDTELEVLYKVSRRTINRWKKKGIIPSKLGHVTKADILKGMAPTSEKDTE